MSVGANGERFRQAEVAFPDGTRTVGWFSTKELRAAAQKGLFRTVKVYSITLVQCDRCGRKVALDVFRCLCEDKKAATWEPA